MKKISDRGVGLGFYGSTVVGMFIISETTLLSTLAILLPANLRMGMAKMEIFRHQGNSRRRKNGVAKI
jgi:hypothetical protein